MAWRFEGVFLFYGFHVWYAMCVLLGEKISKMLHREKICFFNHNLFIVVYYDLLIYLFIYLFIFVWTLLQ